MEEVRQKTHRARTRTMPIMLAIEEKEVDIRDSNALQSMQ